MYAKGMSQRDIADTIEDIYGFEISHETISEITDSVISKLDEWQNRPLKKFYTFVFVDCMYVTIRKDYETKKYAVYTILGYDIDGKKDILGLWLNESESKHTWMQIFDELKNRGVEDILFISMDGVSGLEDGAKAIFKDVVVQRCIVHLIRNSLKYVPSKDYKAFTAHLKKVYGAASLKSAKAEFEKFKQIWSHYPGAIDVWSRNFNHIEQLFDYGSAVRKIIYTTNAVESIHSSFRKVTAKGAFPSENALLKLLYLRITELYKKWKDRPVSNWAMVRNQLSIDDKFNARIQKYEQ
jgi:transposase-like protein